MRLQSRQLVGRWRDGARRLARGQVVCRKTGFAGLAPHDLRRSCAKLCHSAGGELEQIQFLLGHVSVQTTERYLGCKPRIRGAVNDRIGIEP
jgi:integrase